MFNTFTRVGWGIIAAVVLALLLVGYCQVTRPSREASRQAEARATLADGRTAAARDANAVRDGADIRDDQTANTVKEAEDEIRSAPDRAAAADAARRRVCELNDYRGEQCRLFRPDPVRVD